MQKIERAGNFQDESRIVTEEKQDPNEELHPVFTQERFFTDLPLDRKNPLTPVLKDLVYASPRQRLPWSRFMDTSLYHEEFGYYTRNVEIGIEKDFDTFPEGLLPSFGDHVGQSLLDIWHAMGRPSEFQVVEMGAGRGGLALSMLNWGKEKQPEFYKAIQYQIIEQSPKHIRIQKERLSTFNEKEEKQIFPEKKKDKVTWNEGSAIDLGALGISSIKGAIISNELPDAFPIERVTRMPEKDGEKGEIKQKYVTLEHDEKDGKDKWVEVWGDPSLEVAEYINTYKYDIQEGVEEPINLNAATWKKKCSICFRAGSYTNY